jgi:hypothetical protein
MGRRGYQYIIYLIICLFFVNKILALENKLTNDYKQDTRKRIDSLIVYKNSQSIKDTQNPNFIDEYFFGQKHKRGLINLQEFISFFIVLLFTILFYYTKRNWPLKNDQNDKKN